MALIKMNVEVSGINSLKDILKNKYLSAQNVCTSECKKWSDKYTPFQEGQLRNNFIWVKQDGAIKGFTYLVPYARKQWYGKTEYNQDFDYSKVKNPLASARWTDRAINNHKSVILNQIVAELKK